MLPQALCALYCIVWIIKNRKGWGDVLLSLFLALLYSLVVPAISIFCAARELFWSEDYEKDLTDMKGLKMFEILGLSFLFSNL